MKSRILALILLLTLPLSAQADGLVGHTFKMARRGSIYHAARHRGAEVVAYVGKGFGQRARAMAAWRRSAPHARILRMPGLLRTFCWRGYCTGRK